MGKWGRKQKVLEFTALCNLIGFGVLSFLEKLRKEFSFFLTNDGFNHNSPSFKMPSILIVNLNPTPCQVE